MSDRPDNVVADQESSPKMVRWIIIALGVLAGVIVVSLVVAILGATRGSGQGNDDDEACAPDHGGPSIPHRPTPRPKSPGPLRRHLPWEP